MITDWKVEIHVGPDLWRRHVAPSQGAATRFVEYAMNEDLPLGSLFNGESITVTFTRVDYNEPTLTEDGRNRWEVRDANGDLYRVVDFITGSEFRRFTSKLPVGWSIRKVSER